MTRRKYYIVEPDVGESLFDMKPEMFNLKESVRNTIYGIFNGQLYVCYVVYTDPNQINVY